MGALDGIKVVEFSIGIPAPQAALHLAEHGAEVIKIEPPVGETNRFHGGLGNHLPESLPGPQFVAMNRGKRMIVVNAKGERGRCTFYKLPDHSDTSNTYYGWTAWVQYHPPSPPPASRDLTSPHWPSRQRTPAT